MNSDYISKLLALIANPYSLIAIFIGLLAWDRVKHSRYLPWLSFALCGFAASLGKYQDQWIKQPPSLVFPLEQLRDMGRPLTIILLCLLLLLGMQTKDGWRYIFTPQPLKYLIFVQILIFLKILFYGNIGFAFLYALTFGAVVQMVKLGPSRWLQDGQSFYLGVWSLAIVGVIFAVANAYQAAFNMYAVTFTHGRFLGTTGNAQHAAVLLATTIPCFVFQIESCRRNWVKAFWIASLFLVAYFLFLTGSRTGVMMGVASILFFYRHRGGALLRLVLLVSIVLGVIFSLQNQDLATTYAPLTNRFLSGDNTREGAWSGLWNAFINNPLFGAPLEGDRLVFGESSWLAAGATLGLLGFIPLVMFGLGCLKMILQLHNLSKRQPTYFMQSSTIIAGLAAFLVGSFSEAFLLGNLTFPILALLMYLSLGKYLIDVDDIQSQYF